MKFTTSIPSAEDVERARILWANARDNHEISSVSISVSLLGGLIRAYDTLFPEPNFHKAQAAEVRRAWRFIVDRHGYNSEGRTFITELDLAAAMSLKPEHAEKSA